MQSSTNKGQKYSNSRLKVDPDAPKSNQDCKVCNRRRIKCDRGLPTCGKCKSRNLECPGYGLVLKWGQGVASRGKLAGKSLPIRHPEHAVASAASSSTSSSPTRSNSSTSPRQKQTKVPTIKQEKPQHFTNVNVMRVEMGHGELDAEFEEDLDLGGCCGGPNPSHGGWDDWLASNGGIEFFDNKPTMVPSPPNSVYSLDFNSVLPELDLNFELAPQLPAILQNSSVRELLHHYDQSIAPLMVWIDSPSNPWRRLMMPLAMQSPTLLLALLAVSAQHLSAQSGPQGHPTFSHANLKWRDQALSLITQRLKIESMGGFHQDPSMALANRLDSDATLAAIIMLCNYEMVDAHTNAWRTHLDAARTMIKLRGGASRMAADSDPTTAFLLNQFFILDVFASTTTFSDDDGLDLDVHHFEPTGGKEEMFEDFLKVMHQVTRWERQLSNPQRSPPPIPPTEAIQSRFEAARQRTLKVAGNITASLPQRQRDEFAHLINAYHHAGLLYSWRALYDFNPAHPLITTSRRELYNSISMIRDTKRYASDIVYPLFIMGTESVGDEVAQEMVEWRMKEAMAVTGFKNSESALDFLDAFWRQNTGGSWVKFAREWGEQGHAFMVC